MTAAECRKLAEQYRDQAKESGLSRKKATILKNISRSFRGLASQLEILALAEQEHSSQPAPSASRYLDHEQGV
jgi:hypothetical protein